MSDAELALQFERNRDHLRAVARRMLGSPAEAEDAVQETWLRLARSDSGEIANLGGWLTTVVARICLDTLRARQAHPGVPLLEGDEEAALPLEERAGDRADDNLLLADAMGPALMIVLDHLPPAERVAFVLHDVFAVPFDEIARVLDRGPEAARQLASRARKRVQGQGAAPGREDAAGDKARHRGVVDAFLAASRNGDFEGLLAVLHPDAVLRADALAVQVAASRRKAGQPAPEIASETRGARAVAGVFNGKALGARPALLDGEPGAAWVHEGRVRSAFRFTVESGVIIGIELVMEPERLNALKIEIGVEIL